MAYGTRVSYEAIREVAAAGVGAAYGAVGTATTDHTRILRIVSSLDAEVYVSFDGTTDHIRMAGNSFVLYDYSTNKIHDDGLFLSQGTTIYVKRVSGAPTTGSLWIEVVYATGGV